MRTVLNRQGIMKRYAAAVRPGEYLTEETMPPDVLEKFAYIIRSDGTYELRLKGSKQTRFPDMVFEKTPS
ncbi:MAG: hypothetical protein U5R49_08085 [Deltaproteobacteria bacterium]|nr:hypothetical protein [Deltaproteobacteria bacterium]